MKGDSLAGRERAQHDQRFQREVLIVNGPCAPGHLERPASVGRQPGKRAMISVDAGGKEPVIVRSDAGRGRHQGTPVCMVVAGVGSRTVDGQNTPGDAPEPVLDGASAVGIERRFGARDPVCERGAGRRPGGLVPGLAASVPVGRETGQGVGRGPAFQHPEQTACIGAVPADDEMRGELRRGSLQRVKRPRGGLPFVAVFVEGGDGEGAGDRRCAGMAGACGLGVVAGLVGRARGAQDGV